VKAFVEMHGGAVEVQSEVGQGTTFTIRLPAGKA
jgi:signal transduction histidine kinase